MPRSHFRYIIRGTNGLAIQNARANLYVKGTSTFRTDAWSSETGGIQVSFLVSNNQGEIEAWFDQSDDLDIEVTTNSGAAFFVTTRSAANFSVFRETVSLITHVLNAVDAELKIDKSTLDANTVLGALVDNVPVALSGAQVAGLIPSGTYAGATAGGAALASVRRAIERGVEDVHIADFGDSTGDADNEWPTLMAGALATLYPTHTVRVRSWDGSALAWSAAVTISTGSGQRVITWWNGSTSGYQVRTMLTRAQAMLALEGNSAHAVFVSTSHNEDTNMAVFDGYYRTFVATVMSRHPKAGVVLVQQNPTNDAQTYQTQRARVVGEVAASLGCGVANFHDAFTAVVDFSLYMLDTVHPNALGHSALMLPVIQRLWADAAVSTPSQGAKPGARLLENLLVDPRFESYHAGGSGFQAGMPRGWADGGGAGVVISRDGAVSFEVTNKALTANVATLTTSAAHNRRPGEPVTVAGVDATFDGTYTVVAVPTSTTFTYARTAGNVASTASGGTASFPGFYETGTYGLRLQHTGAAGTSSIAYDLTRANIPDEGVPLAQLRGQWVTFGVRIRIPQIPLTPPVGVGGSPNWGNIGIYDGVNPIVKTIGGATGNPGIGYDEWMWVVISAQLSPVATAAQVYIYVNSLGSDPTGDITVDRAFVLRGVGLNDARILELEHKLDQVVYVKATSDIAWAVRVEGDTPGADRIRVRPDGIYFGPGGSGGPDNRLYRRGVGVLGTDGIFRADGAIRPQVVTGSSYPAGPAVGDGVYNQTTTRPMWWSGSDWLDAAKTKVVARAGNFTAADGEIELCNASAGAIAATLPAAAANARVRLKKTDSTNNQVTITPPSGTIDGAAALVLTAPNQAIDAICDGTNWYVL